MHLQEEHYARLVLTASIMATTACLFSCCQRVRAVRASTWLVPIRSLFLIPTGTPTMTYRRRLVHIAWARHGPS